MNDEIGLLRDKLENLIQIAESLTDYKVIYLSQELDKLITNYYLQNARDGVSVSMEQKRQWEILKHIFPVALQHINFYGCLDNICILVSIKYLTRENGIWMIVFTNKKQSN